MEAALAEVRAATGSQREPQQRSLHDALVEFCTSFKDVRCFNQSRDLFIQLVASVKESLQSDQWLLSQAHTHRILMTLRLLLRDQTLLTVFMARPSPLPALTASLSHHTHSHTLTALPQTIHHLQELTNIFQKICHNQCYHEELLSCDSHLILCRLLSIDDLTTLQGAISAIINLCKRPESCDTVVTAHSLPGPLLHILTTHTTTTCRLATDLLLLLSQHSLFRAQLVELNGLTVMIRLLTASSDLHILHHVISVCERLSESCDVREEVRTSGGIPLLLNFLSRNYQDDEIDQVLALKAATCSLLTQLILSDSNAQLVIQLNGLYSVAILLVPTHDGDQRHMTSLQQHALRALSMERNRSLFKNLLPLKLFERFVDIGHYTQDPRAYTDLVRAINTLPADELKTLRANIVLYNQSKAPIFSIGGYSVLELLGSGSFGSVYKVRKPGSELHLALKEIRSSQPELGRSLAERSASLDRLLTEVSITREGLRHRNVVHYHRCFHEGGHLYIVMEYLEGASLAEHVSSLREKRQVFGEERLWRVFSQLVLGLRYLHKDKRIVHRDLSPANVMLGDQDKLTITDFGLAKLRHRELSVCQSAVGTMSYWCPELVHGHTYNEKADIWAAGCILYQMARLEPPFQASNLLALATKIAEVDYPRLDNPIYSTLVSDVIGRCLTGDPEERADSVQLGAMLAEVLMRTVDKLSLTNDSLTQRLHKERQQRRRHMNDAVMTEQRYQKLLSEGHAPKHHDEELDSLQQSMDSVFLERGQRTRSQSAVSSDNWSPLATKSRTTSVASVVSVSPSRVREVSHDPLTLLLTQVHKLVTVTAHPPLSNHTPSRRLLVNTYKTWLFNKEHSLLKPELYKLATQSSEAVIPLADSDNNRLVNSAIKELGGVAQDAVLTYDLLHTVIDSLVSEQNQKTPDIT